MKETLQILLLEDDNSEAEKLILLLRQNEYHVNRAKNRIEAQKQIKKNKFDIIILDIMINGSPEGIKFAQELYQKKINTPFIFLTSMLSNAIFKKAKYTRPFNYLLKPYNELELLYALDLAIESHYRQLNTISNNKDNVIVSPEYIFVKKENRVDKIKVSTICFVEVDDRYCTLNASDGLKYLVKRPLKKIKDILPNATFKQVHRGYLVNIDKVKEIYFNDNLIVVDGGSKIPFSRNYKKNIIMGNIFLK